MLLNVKAISVVVLLVFTSLIFYMAFVIDNEEKNELSVIELNGNIHLPKDKYFDYAKISDSYNYKFLNISVIRDRIQKHPYVEKVDVVQIGSNLKIDITEKRFDALMLVSDNQFFITESSDIIPVLPFTKKIDYPIIINPEPDKIPAAMQSIKNSESVVTALKMITAIKLVNPDLYENISEIDLRDGRDIIIYLSNIEYPIVIGRNHEVKKVIYFSNLWNYLKGKNVNGVLNYIDLRFTDLIFLGLSNNYLEDGARKI